LTVFLVIIISFWYSIT